MGLEGKQRRFGLGTKLNIMLIAGILLAAVIFDRYKQKAKRTV